MEDIAVYRLGQACFTDKKVYSSFFFKSWF
jgi:hypothetical protein